MAAGRPVQDNASKACGFCGNTFTRLGLKLGWVAWDRRRFCSEPCRRDSELRSGRGSANFVARIETRLTRAEHYAFWTERFTPAEIREVGSCLDFLGDEAVAA